MSGPSRSRSASPARGRGRSRSRSRSNGGRTGKDGPKSLMVRNISFDTSSHELKDIFSKYGEVRDVYIPRDYHTRRPKSFAFVEYLDPEDAR